MAYQFRIARIEWTPTGEVTTTMAVAPNGEVIDYFPQSPRLTTDKTRGALEGAIPVAHQAENSVESFQLSFLKESDAWDAFHDLEGALERALQWAEGFRRDMRTVIQFRDSRRHAADEWYEAQLFDGRVEMGRGPIVRVTWERAPYWSGAEAILQVQNQWSGGWQNYAGIYSCDDAQHNNWVYVEAPSGNAPALPRIRVNNTYPDNRLREVQIGWSDRPQALTFEGEDSELIKTIMPGVEYSNQAIARARQFRWDIPQSNVKDYVGQFRVLANGNLAGGTWRVAAGWELSRRQYGTRAPVAGGNGLTDLGIITLPPGRYAHPVRYTITIWMDGSAEGTLDYLAFIPVQGRQFRRLTFRGYNALPGTCIEDDGWRDEVVYEIGGTRMAELDVYGDPIALWPDDLLPGTAGSRQQMLSFVLLSDYGASEALRSANVQVYCRPRWRTLP